MVDRRDLQNEEHFLSRIYVGQVSHVDDENGIMHVVVPQLVDGLYPLAVPVGALSVNNFGSSWDRHMPRTNDFVLIGFSADNTPEVLAMTTWSAEPSAAGTGVYVDRKNGYARISRLAENAQAGQKASSNGSDIPIGLTEFVTLKGGEFDKRSSGGAYFHGSRFGILTLAGGQVTYKLDKQRNELRGQSGLYSWESEKCYVHFGDVKRVLTPGGLPSAPPVPPTFPFNPTYPGKEYNLHVAGSVGGLVELPIYDLKLGDCRAALGVPVLPITGTPIRLDETLYGIDGLTQVYERKMDALGNWQTTTPLAALQTYSAPLATASVALAVMNVVASGAVAVSAGAAMSLSAGAAMSLSAGAALSMTAVGLATLTAATGISLVTPTPVSPILIGGPAAVFSAVHGENLLIQLGVLVNGLNALCAGLEALEGGPTTPKGALYQAMVVVLTALTTALAVPPGPAGLLSLKVKVE